MDPEELKEKALKLHRKHKGKIALKSKVPLNVAEDLTLAYTPGVAHASLAIATRPSDIFKYTSKGNWVAIVTDGSAVLGLGNIGADAALPVMEGKAVLFKRFANLDAFPICIKSQEPDVIVETAKQVASSFGGVNLEDIAAPRCFEVERKLQEALDIPVFHDDQHGTAIVVSAALHNALALAGKKLEEEKIVVCGAGAAGTAVSKLLLEQGAKHLLVCDKNGIVNAAERYEHAHLNELAALTNPEKRKGGLAKAMDRADVFIGVSAGGIVKKEMVEKMNAKAIVFALANPVPEIFPNAAKEGGAFIVATGRSDYANQVNNALAFPGVFKGALKARAKRISKEMKLAASEALANVIPENELREDYILPSIFNPDVVKKVSEAVAEAAKTSGATK